MIRSRLIRAGAVLTSAATVFAAVASVALFSAPSYAAGITLNDSNCDSFSLSGAAPNQVLSCVVSNAPTGCTISGPTSGQINVPITLTAQCATGSPNAWTWTGGNCANVTTQSCSAVSAAVGQVTYSVTPRNNIGAGNTPSTIVTWSNTPPAAPTGCTLSANPTSLPAAGGQVVLTANCSGGGAPTSYLWTGLVPSSITTTPSQTSQPLTTTSSFTVLPSNAGGNGNLAQVSVTVGTVVNGFCGNYATVLPTVNATWAQQGGPWLSSQGGPFGDNTIWVFKLTVPAGTPASGVTGRFTVSEYTGAPTPRQLTISTQACDFRQKDYTGANGPLAVSNGSTASISYAVATPFIFGPAGLTAGQTYYINVRNWQLDPSPQWSCGLARCDAIMNDAPATP
jgi:hypothetical protein